MGAGAGDRHHPHRHGDHHRGHAFLPRRRVPATRPSLGTLIRIGNEFLYSGEWWITVFRGGARHVVLSVNLLGTGCATR